MSADTTEDVMVFVLPDVGEGLVEAEVAEWKVDVGDLVEINDPIIDIETAKSLVEVPSPYQGRVVRLFASVGETVAVGAPLISFDTGPNELRSVKEASTDESKQVVDRADEPEDHAAGEAEPTAPVPSVPCPTPSQTVEQAPAVLVGTAPQEAADRRYRIKNRPVGPAGTLLPASGVPQRASRQTRVPVRGVRRATAKAMASSVQSAPHASVWLPVDMTNTTAMVQALRLDKAWSDVRVTPMLFVCRAMVIAIKAFPEINSTWDEPAQEIVIKHDINLGLAVASPRGLLVPNVKNAEDLHLRDLGMRIDQLVAAAREGRTPLADMTGGTLTLTNVGVFGVEGAQPILNPGEAAIVAMGSIIPRPWAFERGIALRDVMQLTISFDHRVVDGQQASLFLARVAEVLSDPGRGLLYA